MNRCRYTTVARVVIAIHVQIALTNLRIISRESHAQQSCPRGHATEFNFQTLAFNAATGNAFTIFLAGFAFTMTTFPNTSRFPAFVAGFVRIFKRANPGTVNTPVFFTSSVATRASSSRHLDATVFFTSHAVANASAMPPLDMALTAAFAFIGAMTIDTE